MNTRGLVELVILNAGLDLGILSPTLFTMMVLMALTTTFMTTPILIAMKIQPQPEHSE
jgi:Kef-type K+ transport system membrane component KefB